MVLSKDCLCLLHLELSYSDTLSVFCEFTQYNIIYP